LLQLFFFSKKFFILTTITPSLFLYESIFPNKKKRWRNSVQNNPTPTTSLPFSHYELKSVAWFIPESIDQMIYTQRYKPENLHAPITKLGKRCNFCKIIHENRENQISTSPFFLSVRIDSTKKKKKNRISSKEERWLRREFLFFGKKRNKITTQKASFFEGAWINYFLKSVNRKKFYFFSIHIHTNFNCKKNIQGKKRISPQKNLYSKKSNVFFRFILFQKKLP